MAAGLGASIFSVVGLVKHTRCPGGGALAEMVTVGGFLTSRMFSCQLPLLYLISKNEGMTWITRRSYCESWTSKKPPPIQLDRSEPGHRPSHTGIYNEQQVKNPYHRDGCSFILMHKHPARSISV